MRIGCLASEGGVEEGVGELVFDDGGVDCGVRGGRHGQPHGEDAVGTGVSREGCLFCPGSCKYTVVPEERQSTFAYGAVGRG